MIYYWVVLIVLGLSQSLGASTCSPSLLGAPCHDYHHSSDNTLAGNPINLATGNKYQDEVDLFPMKGGLELVRYYNSLDHEVGVLGRGWKWSYDERLYRLQTPHPQLIYADGQRIYFSSSKDGHMGWFHQQRGQHTLIYLPVEKNWVVFSPVVGEKSWAWRRIFDSQGYLIRLSIVLWTGQLPLSQNILSMPTRSELVFKRASRSGRLLSVWQADRPTQRFDYEYDKQGRNIAVNTPVGRFEMMFDEQKQTLLHVIRPDRYGMAYQYDEYGYLSRRALLDATGKPKYWLLGAWQYASDGRVTHYVGRTEQFSIRYEGMSTEVLTALGKRSRYEFAPYEGGFQLVKLTGEPCQSCPRTPIKQMKEAANLTSNSLLQVGVLPVVDTRMKDSQWEHWQYDNGIQFFVQGDERIVFDKSGNLLWHSLLKRDPQGRVIQLLQAFPFLSEVRTLSLSYDDQGRLKSSQDTKGVRHYTWFDRSRLPIDGKLSLRFTPTGQLSEVFRSEKRLAHYDYYNHQRTRKAVYATDGHLVYERYFVYEGYQLRYERTYYSHHSAGDQARVYHYRDQYLIGFTDMDEHGQHDYFVQTNHLGAPVLVTDQSGEVVWVAVYDALSKATVLFEKIPLHLRLPGQYADEETGWYDNQYRTYLPDQGTFLQPDPMGQREGVSLYGFSDKYHLNRIDPWGLYLVAFDGTSMRPENMSNIYQLSQRYQGVSRYYSGIGTHAESAVKRVFNMAFGGGGSAILEKAFTDLMSSIPSVAEDGRLPMLTLDMIGFSRGAALALDFAQYLSQHLKRGILYDVQGKPRACIQLRFLGLLDIVRQMDINRLQGEKILHQLPLSWQHVVHAVALNEHNTLFPLTKLTSTDVQAYTQLKQYGFIGAHGDIGGGRYEEDTQSDYAQRRYGDLSKISQAWLQWQAQQAGVSFDTKPSLAWTVDNPIMHKTLLLEPSHPFARRYTYQIDSEDRPIYDRAGHYQGIQGRDTVLGDQTRMQTDRLVHFRKAYVTENAVGRVDVDSYKRWLKNTYHWDMDKAFHPD